MSLLPTRLTAAFLLLWIVVGCGELGDLGASSAQEGADEHAEAEKASAPIAETNPFILPAPQLPSAEEVAAEAAARSATHHQDLSNTKRMLKLQADLLPLKAKAAMEAVEHPSKEALLAGAKAAAQACFDLQLSGTAQELMPTLWFSPEQRRALAKPGARQAYTDQIDSWMLELRRDAGLASFNVQEALPHEIYHGRSILLEFSTRPMLDEGGSTPVASIQTFPTICVSNDFGSTWKVATSREAVRRYFGSQATD